MNHTQGIQPSLLPFNAQILLIYRIVQTAEAAGQAQRRFLTDMRGLQGELSVVAQQIES